MRFRVVTWNVHKGIGGLDRRYRLERVIGVLRALAPDIALLQEVADDLPRAGHHDQVRLLSDALGMPNWAFDHQHRFSRGGYGNAILSKTPLYDVHQVDLTIGTRKKRGVLQARTRIRIGNKSRTIVCYCLHLGLAGSERAEQLGRFLGCDPFRGLHHRTPVVLGGDLNDLWGTLGHRFLEPAGFVRAGRLINTFPAWLPIRPLDGIFVRGDAIPIHAGTTETGLSRTASDHLPLVVEIQLRGVVRR